jgi:Ca2+-binding EF-hand superfamily protein
LVIVGALVCPAWAQTSGDARHRDRERSPGGLDPKERLRRFDTNGNGILEPEEVPPYVKSFLASRTGVQLDKPMPLDELAARIQAHRDGREVSVDRKDRDKGRSDSAPTTKAESLVPGFGVKSDRPLPPGFDVPQNIALGTHRPLKERYNTQVLEYVENMLKRYDKNGNHCLDSDEWKDVPWRGDPRESDLNKDGRLSKEELCERIAKRFERDKVSANSGSASHPSSTGSASSSTSTSSGGSSAEKDRARIRSYAESLLRQYDENKNGRLEKDEIARMRGSWHEADKNHDGVLTLDEIADRLMVYGTGGAEGGPAKSASLGGGKPRRFLTPTERLPPGLPSWFARSDTDGDGQIALAEFAPPGNREKVAEFSRYDLNGDGFVTATECLAAEKKAQAETKK